jgi:hypothetical protein
MRRNLIFQIAWETTASTSETATMQMTTRNARMLGLLPVLVDEVVGQG